MIVMNFHILRVEWEGEGADRRLKITIQYNEGVEGYRYLREPAATRFLDAIKAALHELKVGPWLTKGEG